MRPRLSALAIVVAGLVATGIGTAGASRSSSQGGPQAKHGHPTTTTSAGTSTTAKGHRTTTTTGQTATTSASTTTTTTAAPGTTLTGNWAGYVAQPSSGGSVTSVT